MYHDLGEENKGEISALFNPIPFGILQEQELVSRLHGSFSTVATKSKLQQRILYPIEENLAHYDVLRNQEQCSYLKCDLHLGLSQQVH
jgi:hypothetical protein